MNLETLGFWDLIKLDLSIDIELLSRYWMWIIGIMIICIIYIFIFN